MGAAAVRRLPDSLLGPRARFRRRQRGGGGGQGNQRGRLRRAGQRGAAQPGAEKGGPLPAPGGQPPGAELALFHPPGAHRPVAALLREGAHRPAAGGLPAPGPAVLANQPPAGHGRGPGRLFGTAGLFPKAGGVPALGGGGRGGGLSRQPGGVPRGPVPCAGPLRPAGLLAAGGPARAGCLRLLRCPRREELHLGRGHGEHRQPARL